MLIKAKTINGYKLHATDGEIGTVKDFFFDDRHWTIRYLVVDTGNWLESRQVLLSPYAIISLHKEEEYIEIDLTMQQIEESPPLKLGNPITVQFEEEYYKYFGWPMYYFGPYMWGYTPYIERDPEKWKEFTQDKRAWDPHLRSMEQVGRHDIEARDGGIGHVDDFVIDDEKWAIRYLIVATRNWWPGKKVLVSPLWIDRVSWNEYKVYVSLSRDTIKISPEYTEESLLTREYESDLYQHYKNKGYWESEKSDQDRFQH
ncbi:MAG: PRC-barrel domain-containing protein [Oligoflexia bacterium]|nr:PRC-barrel domain-containing protein [Oligoflexia bacterium]MBF0364092.1 PRC-barrel domain-containing protein [Oligoflexia bacterium]